jgi:hypothetical protein
MAGNEGVKCRKSKSIIMKTAKSAIGYLGDNQRFSYQWRKIMAAAWRRKRNGEAAKAAKSGAAQAKSESDEAAKRQHPWRMAKAGGMAAERRRENGNGVNGQCQ